MKFVVVFEDARDAEPEIRKTFMAEHLEFLEANAKKIEAAGPLRDPDGRGRDGLWIVEAEACEEVERLVHEDPFWPTGLRKSFAIIPWRQVYLAGSRVIQPT